jgi:hypothetical protein
MVAIFNRSSLLLLVRSSLLLLDRENRDTDVFLDQTNFLAVLMLATVGRPLGVDVID